MMQEEYLHYLYRLKLLGNQFQTTDGRMLEIHKFGHHNSNAGPDFLEARILLDGQAWAGPIEFHVKSSDWYLHRHQHDKRYGNVIVHFVFEHDREVYSGNYKLPVVELKSRIDPEHFKRYQDLAHAQAVIPCQSQLKSIEPFIIFQQKERALTNRLERKAAAILSQLKETRGDTERVFYQALATVFGGKVNADAFCRMLENLDIKTLRRSNEINLTVPAILFGVSGLFPENSADPYVRQLIAEFTFQQHRLGLPVLPKESWRYSRMHPQGFPDLRIAQFAALICHRVSADFFLQDELSVQQIHLLFDICLPAYWGCHYRFGVPAKPGTTKLSASFINLLIINCIVPFVFAHGLLHDHAAMKERAVNLLADIAPEKNTILKKWSELGIRAGNAFDSQALIEQKNEFCSAKKCLFCRIGTQLLRA